MSNDALSRTNTFGDSDFETEMNTNARRSTTRKDQIYDKIDKQSAGGMERKMEQMYKSTMTALEQVNKGQGSFGGSETDMQRMFQL